HRATDGYQLLCTWRDRRLLHLLGIQGEIAQTIAGTVRIEIGNNGEPLARRNPGNLHAYNLYLRGRYWWNKRTADGFAKALECFEQAIAADTECAPAYAGLGGYYMALGFWGIAPPSQMWPMARQKALKGAQIENLAEIQISLAWCDLFEDWNTDGAEERLKRAIEQNPSHADAHYAYSVYLTQVERLEPALSAMKRAYD